MSENIEKKIPIAADAAETVTAYLNEINMRLIKAGVEDSYIIVSQIEENILDTLKELGKETKITINEVLDVINSISTPEEFVKEYTRSSEMSDIYNREDLIIKQGRDLPKRVKKEKIKPVIKNPIHIDSLFVAIYKLIFIITILVVPVDIFSLVHSLYTFNLLLLGRSLTGLVLINLFYFFNELISAFNGKLLFSVKTSKKIRYTIRGLNLTTLYINIYTYFNYGRILFYFTHYQNFFISYLGQFIIINIIVFIVTELFIFMRDHISGLYPLEPDYKPAIRFITIPYLTVYAGIFAMSPDQNVLIAMFIFYFGYLYGILRNYPLTMRYHVFIWSLMFNSMVIGYYLPNEYTLLPLFNIFVVIYLIIYIIRRKTKTNKTSRKIIGPIFTPLKNMISNMNHSIKKYKETEIY